MLTEDEERGDGAHGPWLDLVAAGPAQLGEGRRLRRVGSGWLDHKLITDRDTGKVYGPYLYARWREGTRTRTKYLGKV